MRRVWFILAIALISKIIGAQDYQISFSISGNEETSIDSVVVYNLAQDHMITMRGDDILHLVASTTGRNKLNIPKKKLKIYPNPFSNKAIIVFQNDRHGLVELSLYDMAGKILVHKSLTQPAGNNCVEVSGLPAGPYLIQIDTETSSFSEIILSNDLSGIIPAVNFLGTGENPGALVSSLKSSISTAELVEMQYNDGDTLSLTAYLGGLYSEIKIVPVASTSISFEFGSNQEDMRAEAEITIEGGILQVSDEAGNSVSLSFPPGAVMDTTMVTLTIKGENKELPIAERNLRTFEISPADLNLYRPVEITIDYHESISKIEQTALFRLRSESWLIPLSDHSYGEDNRSLSASTFILGEFAEGEMTLEQINTQFDLLVADLGITWSPALKSTEQLSNANSDGRLHKAIWDEYKEKASGMLKLIYLRLLIGYYDELPPGKPTLQQEMELLCKEVISKGVQEVLDMGLPEDPCDRDYTHTLTRMMYDMNLLGCTEDAEFARLDERFQQMLIDCSSFLTITSVTNIESGGITITTSGVVPITTTASSNGMASVEGSGTLEVTGSGQAGGECTSIVSGITLVDVSGTRDAAYTYVLTLETDQAALLITTCPHAYNETPLTGSGSREVTLSKANGFSATYEETINGTVFTMDVTLDNPYTSMPAPE